MTTIIPTTEAPFTKGERVRLVKAGGAYSKFTPGQEVTITRVDTSYSGATYFDFEDDLGQHGGGAAVDRFEKLDDLAEWERELLAPQAPTYRVGDEVTVLANPVYYSWGGGTIPSMTGTERVGKTVEVIDDGMGLRPDVNLRVRDGIVTFSLAPESVAHVDTEERPAFFMDEDALSDLPVGSVLRELDPTQSEWVRTESGLVYHLMGDTLEQADARAYPLTEALHYYGPFELISEPEQDTPEYVLDVEGIRALPVGTKLADSHGAKIVVVERGLAFWPSASELADLSTIKETRTWVYDGRDHGLVADALAQYGPFEVVEYGPEPEVEAPQAYRIVIRSNHFFEVGTVVYLTNRYGDESGIYSTDLARTDVHWENNVPVAQIVRHSDVEAIVEAEAQPEVEVAECHVCDVMGMFAPECLDRRQREAGVEPEVVEAEVIEDEEETFGFKAGDRIRFVESYGSDIEVGDTGTVKAVDLPIYDNGFLYIDLDNGGSTSCFPYRVELLTDEAEVEGDVFIHEEGVLDALFKGSAILTTERIVHVLDEHGSWYAPATWITLPAEELAELGFRVLHAG